METKEIKKSEKKVVIINIISSLIIGLILGAITEFSLIINNTFLNNIMQSYLFWGIVLIIFALFSENYMLSILNPAVVISFMNISYYMIRFIKSGYTDKFGFLMYFLTGIAGAICAGTFFTILKKVMKKKSAKKEIINFAFIIAGFFIFTFSFKNIYILNNLFYNIDIGIIFGFILGSILNLYLKIRKRKLEIDK